MKDVGATIATVGLAIVGAIGVQMTRGPLAERTHEVKVTEDTYTLPPPEQLPVLCLGYRAAAADVLWATTLVTQGLRLQEHRRFDYGARYFQSIVTLDPTFRDPYLLVDAVLTFGAVKASRDDIVATRALLEQGVAARPTDAQILYNAGAFIAYIAPGYLENEQEAEAWERDGSELLMRAAALGQGDVQTLALGGGGILNRLGQRDAAVSFYERIYAITDDEETRRNLAARLHALHADENADRARASAKAFDDAWKHDLGFVSRSTMLLLGRKVDPFACAGVGGDVRPGCEHRFVAAEVTGPRPAVSP